MVSRQEELTVAGKRESYKVLKTESNIPHGVKAVDEAFGTISAGEFGAVLSRIFDSETETSFHWARSGKLRGGPVVVFSFEVAGAPASKAVLRVETHVSDILPEKFGGVDLTLDYKAVKIGESEFVLPYRFDLEWPHRHMLIDSPGSRSPILREGPGLSVTAEYQDYRGYSAESALGFGGADSQNDIHSAISFGGIVPADKK